MRIYNKFLLYNNKLLKPYIKTLLSLLRAISLLAFFMLIVGIIYDQGATLSSGELVSLLAFYRIVGGVFVVDIVLVAIGENYGAAITIVALLKQKKVRRIFARAIDRVHKVVIAAFNLEKILTIKEEATQRLAWLLDFNANMETFRVDKDYRVVNFAVPKKLVGYNVNTLNLVEEFNIKLLCSKHYRQIINALGISVCSMDVKNELPEKIRIEEGD